MPKISGKPHRLRIPFRGWFQHRPNKSITTRNSCTEEYNNFLP